MKKRIYYKIWDGGDGSASPKFYKTRAEMDADEGDPAYDEYDLSEGGSYEDFEIDELEDSP